MRRAILALAGGLAVAACGDTGDGPGPFEPGPQDGDTDTDDTAELEENTVPDALAGNLRSIAFDPQDETLTVEVASLDASPVLATYERRPGLDVDGYAAFSTQSDPLDRLFLGLARSSADGSVEAAVVADGGQFNEFLGGGFYDRAGGFDRPESGLVSYAGRYAGLTNLPDRTGVLQPQPPGTPAEVAVGQPRRTAGAVFLNVDFDDNSVNGTLYDHRFANGEGLPSLALTITDVAETGEFLGSAEAFGMPGQEMGQYGGILGKGADSVAGIVSLDTIFLPEDPRDTDFDRERGVFVVPRCGTAGSPPICGDVNDFDSLPE